MNGMGIMLKSLGIDPDMLANIGREMGEKLVSFETRLTAIEATLKRVEELLTGAKQDYEQEEIDTTDLRQMPLPSLSIGNSIHLES